MDDVSRWAGIVAVLSLGWLLACSADSSGAKNVDGGATGGGESSSGGSTQNGGVPSQSGGAGSSNTSASGANGATGGDRGSGGGAGTTSTSSGGRQGGGGASSGGADAGGGSGEPNDAGGGAPLLSTADAACRSGTDVTACTTCCDQHHPGAYMVQSDATRTCVCTTGGCEPMCSDSYCVSVPQSTQHCYDCVYPVLAKDGACFETSIRACGSDAECASYVVCRANCVK